MPRGSWFVCTGDVCPVAVTAAPAVADYACASSVYDEEALREHATNQLPLRNNNMQYNPQQALCTGKAACYNALATAILGHTNIPRSSLL